MTPTATGKTLPATVRLATPIDLLSRRTRRVSSAAGFLLETMFVRPKIPQLHAFGRAARPESPALGAGIKSRINGRSFHLGLSATPRDVRMRAAIQ